MEESTFSNVQTTNWILFYNNYPQIGKDIMKNRVLFLWNTL